MENKNYDEVVYKCIWDSEDFHLVRIIKENKENKRYFIVKKVPRLMRLERVILPKILSFVEQNSQ